MATIKLLFPVRPISINQGFGGNRATYAQFGLDGHNGLDLQTYHGQPVYASHDGTAYYNVDSSGGNGIVIVSNEAYDYNGKQVHFKTLYWHLADPIKEPMYYTKYLSGGANNSTGIPIKAGEILGLGKFYIVRNHKLEAMPNFKLGSLYNPN